MGEAYSGGGVRPTIDGEGIKAATGGAGILSLAASPTFAVMAVLTGAADTGAPDMLCAATHQVASLNGMTVMYLLMSGFHSGPWLRLVSNRLSGVRAGWPVRRP